MIADRGAGRVPIAAYYFLLYAGIGISLPYLPQHFRSLGLSGRDLGLIASIGPTMSLVVPPVAGYVADRTRRPDLLLSLAGFGVSVGNALLSMARTLIGALGPMVIVNAFGAPQSVLVDSITIERVRATGGAYSRLRLWGSVGFVVASFLFGQFYRGERDEVPKVVLAALAVSLAYTVVSLAIRAEGTVGRPSLRDAAGLLLRRDLLLLCGLACLHWIACAPYNLLFVVHAKAIGIPPSIAGIALALGVVAEVLVMAAFPAIEARVALPRVLSVSFAASAARWWLTGSVADPVAIVAAQVLHGFTFGAFYVASVSYLSCAVPARLRASGQALFAASAFGVGGIVGYLAAGRAYDLVGGAALFRYAGLVAVAPVVLSLFLPGPRLPAAGAAGTLDAP